MKKILVFPLQETSALTISFFEKRDLEWHSRSGEMSLFDKLIVGVCYCAFFIQYFSVTCWVTSLLCQVSIVQTVLYPVAKTFCLIKTCVFTKAENLGHILWSTWY